jgi:ribosomal-protein-alanine N-acetyltransferase
MSLSLRDDIVTSRLSLIAVTPEMVRSQEADDGMLGGLTQCVIPKGWPMTEWEPHVYKFLLDQFAEHPEQIGWHRYVSFVPPGGSRTLIGALGAFLKGESECEIGYSVLPGYDGRGFTTEAARALIEYLRGDERLESVIAHTFPSIPGSIRVMEKCGMTFDGDGEEAGTVRYRLRLRTLR